MTATTARIARATAGDVEQLAALIAEAFEPLHASQWLVPDPDDRRRVLAADFAILVEHAIRWGQVDTTWDRAAVAVWVPRGVNPAPRPDDYDRRLAQACRPYTDNFRHLDALFDAHHPTEPHHHLALLAVAPEMQRAGLGGALLRNHEVLLDEHHMPAYLEASDRRSRALYLRHGYVDTGEPFDLPNGALFWPMWRPPSQPRCE